MHTPTFNEPWNRAVGDPQAVYGFDKKPVYVNGRLEGCWFAKEEYLDRAIDCVNALSGIESPVALRTALEELLESYSSRGKIGLYPICAKIIALLPPKETP